MGKRKKWTDKLTKDDIKLIREIHSSSDISWDEKMNTLMNAFKKSERTIRRGIKDLGFSKKSDEGVVKSEQLETAKKKEHAKGKKVYFITWAQNNTNLNTKFFKNIEAYADFRDAEVLVVAGRYRNPTSLRASFNSKEKEAIGEVRWDNKLLPYLTANRHNIHKYLNILSDVRVMPTAETPLSGFEGFSGLESTVIGHPKQNMRPMPVLEGYPHKVLFSTGAVTERNYTDSKAGKKGEFHHTFGFLIVEIVNEEHFHIRNVAATESGEFNDLIYNVKNGEVTDAKPIEALVMGDLHSGQEDLNLINETFILADNLKPKRLVLHDVFDATSISHHNDKDPFKKHRLMLEGKNSVERELDTMNKNIGVLSSIGETFIVKSNHDEHLDKYLKEKDWKKDLVNAEAYMEISLALLKGDAPNGALPYVIGKKNPEVKCLGDNESLNIKGVECGLHGDRGTNGSRGSITQFKRLNVRTITAHSHSPYMQSGAYSVGTSTRLRLDYNKGLSSWLQAHVTIDDLGKRQMLLFINEKFTTLF